MAERRRRRRLSEESGDELSENSQEPKSKDRPFECESEGEHEAEIEVSDYESVNEEKEKEEEEKDDDEEDEEEGSSDDDEEETSDDDDDDDEEEEEEDGEEIVEEFVDDELVEEYYGVEERQSGDGEEQPEESQKELDDDEDRRNPAYVPRKGVFYEHDTRLTEDAEQEQRPKKKLWKDEGKWQHDRYREDQQAPKSKEELVALYGYDIRAKDKPPAAAPRINRPRVRKSQQRPRLGDFMEGDAEQSLEQSPMETQRNNLNTYQNRKSSQWSGTRRGGRGYGDNNVSNVNRNCHNKPRQRSLPLRQFTNSSYRVNNDGGSYRNSEGYKSENFRTNNEKSSNYRGNSDSNYKAGAESPGSYRFNRNSSGYRKGGSGDASFRNNVECLYKNAQDKRVYSNNVESRNGHENKQRTPERNILQTDESGDSVPKQKNLLNNSKEFSGTVITANSNVERKSYSKERRHKGNGRIRVLDTGPQIAEVEEQLTHLTVSEEKSEPEIIHSSSQTNENNSNNSNLSLAAKSAGEKTFTSVSSSTPLANKQETTTHQSRPKRYSSQRQRNLPDMNFTEQLPVDNATYYNPASYAQPPLFHPEQGHPPQERAYQTAMLQPPPPIPFTLPVTTPGIPSPPRMYGPGSSVSLAGPPAGIITPQYISGGMIYSAPPPAYRVPVMPGYQSPPPRPPAPPPPPTQNQLQELYRGGTTYYCTDLQHPSPSRSPVRRYKSAIPIVNPYDLVKSDETFCDADSSHTYSHGNDEILSAEQSESQLSDGQFLAHVHDEEKASYQDAESDISQLELSSETSVAASEQSSQPVLEAVA